MGRLKRVGPRRWGHRCRPRSRTTGAGRSWAVCRTGLVRLMLLGRPVGPVRPGGRTRPEGRTRPGGRTRREVLAVRTGSAGWAGRTGLGGRRCPENRTRPMGPTNRRRPEGPTHRTRPMGPRVVRGRRGRRVVWSRRGWRAVCGRVVGRGRRVVVGGAGGRFWLVVRLRWVRRPGVVGRLGLVSRFGGEQLFQRGRTPGRTRRWDLFVRSARPIGPGRLVGPVVEGSWFGRSAHAWREYSAVWFATAPPVTPPGSDSQTTK